MYCRPCVRYKMIFFFYFSSTFFILSEKITLKSSLDDFIVKYRFQFMSRYSVKQIKNTFHSETLLLFKHFRFFRNIVSLPIPVFLSPFSLLLIFVVYFYTRIIYFLYSFKFFTFIIIPFEFYFENMLSALNGLQ